MKTNIKLFATRRMKLPFDIEETAEEVVLGKILRIWV